MLRAALYARVSTDMQEKEQTIQSQLAAITQYAEEHGLRTTPALTYSDDGFSGSHLDRPALDELRDHAREGRFDVVVVLCPDRLARRYAYQVLLIEELNRAEVEVHFCERPITDSPDDQLLLQIQGAIAEYERAKILERSRRGRLYRARMGELTPGELPYGYQRTPKRYGGDGRIRIHEEEVALVRQIFEWYDEEGATLHTVAAKLTASEWETRAGKNEWSASAVGRILRCEWYIGRAYYNRTKCTRNPRSVSEIPSKRAPRFIRSKRPRAEWIEVAVPSIIDEDLFRRAQTRLSENRRFARRRLKQEGVFLLRGLLKCGLCGHAYIAMTERKRYKGTESLYHYYLCNQRQSRPPGGIRCPNERLRAMGANEAVWTTVRDLLLDSDALAKELSDWLERATTVGPEEDGRLQKAEARLQELIRQRDRLTDAYQTGALPLEVFRMRIEAIEEGRLTTQHALAELRAQQLETEVARHRAASAKQAVEVLRPTLLNADFDTQQTILRLLVERVVVRGQHLEIHLAVPVSSNSCLTSDTNTRGHGRHRGRPLGARPRVHHRPARAGGARLEARKPPGRGGPGAGAAREPRVLRLPR